MSTPACCCRQLCWYITSGCQSRCEKVARVRAYINNVPTRLLRFTRLDISEVCAARSLTRGEKRRLFDELIACIDDEENA